MKFYWFKMGLFSIAGTYSLVRAIEASEFYERFYFSGAVLVFALSVTTTVHQRRADKMADRFDAMILEMQERLERDS